MFNYLEDNASKKLNVKKELKSLHASSTTTRVFYTECVSYSRACLLPLMANAWEASTKWSYEKDGYAYLEDMLFS